jgi:hypothetical protein
VQVGLPAVFEIVKALHPSTTCNSDIWGMAESKSLELLGHGFGNVTGSNNGDGNGRFRELPCGCLCLQNGLRKKRNQSVTSGFSRPLQLYDKFLVIGVYDAMVKCSI